VLLAKDYIWSESTRPVEIDVRDKDDIPILSTAVSAKAEIFVTGDVELLELERIRSMRILSPRSFWEFLKSEWPH
jgi:predicted nucleic acid-binding protein